MTVHKFSQSWLNTFSMCPEQARMDRAKELPRIESDATAIGTSFHSVAETVLGGGTLDDAILAAQTQFVELSKLDEFVWVQVKTEATALKYLELAARQWHEKVYPQLGNPLGIEQSFDVCLFTSPDREIRLTGTIDYVEAGRIWDWKTANRAYEEWEARRFKIQPTVYTAGWFLTNAEQVAADPEVTWLTAGPIEFSYAIALKGKSEIQIVDVTRGPGHWEWLLRQCHAICDLIEADLPHWPLVDQGWHCSGRWCGAWDTCKGAHLGDN